MTPSGWLLRVGVDSSPGVIHPGWELAARRVAPPLGRPTPRILSSRRTRSPRLLLNPVALPRLAASPPCRLSPEITTALKINIAIRPENLADFRRSVTALALFGELASVWLLEFSSTRQQWISPLLAYYSIYRLCKPPARDHFRHRLAGRTPCSTAPLPGRPSAPIKAPLNACALRNKLLLAAGFIFKRHSCRGPRLNCLKASFMKSAPCGEGGEEEESEGAVPCQWHLSFIPTALYLL
jgi:hypothetical protein